MPVPSQRRPTKRVGAGKSATFFSEEEATGLNNAMDKNIICSRGNVCNLVKLSFAHCLQELIVWLINQNLTKTQIFLNGKLAFILRRRKSLIRALQ